MNTVRTILHPCFCGSIPSITLELHDLEPTDPKRWYVLCDTCKQSTAHRNTVSEAIIEWNDTHPLRRDGL